MFAFVFVFVKKPYNFGCFRAHDTVLKLHEPF
jgi:hypothetical protein